MAAATGSTTGNEYLRQSDARPQAIKEGEVSSFKICVCILLREYYLQEKYKPLDPESRVTITYFFHKLITVSDQHVGITYRRFIRLCRAHLEHISLNVFLATLWTLECTQVEHPSFLNDLAMSIVDALDATQTIILKKKVAKASPVGKFLLLNVLNIRKMTYPQICQTYAIFWRYIRGPSLQSNRLKDLVQSAEFIKSIHPQTLDYYNHQHPSLQKKLNFTPGIVKTHLLLHSRARAQKTGYGPRLIGLPTTGHETYRQLRVKDRQPITMKSWPLLRTHNRKLIEKTVKVVSAETGMTGCRRYTPRQISTFVKAIHHNPSSRTLVSQLYFMEFLSLLYLKDLRRCPEALRLTFDLKKQSPSEMNKGSPYASYNFALLYDFLGYRKDALTSLSEAFQSAHVACDQLCIHFCCNLWASLYQTNYLGAVQESLKEMDKSLAYLHSSNLLIHAINIQVAGEPATEIFKTLKKSSTGLDLEHSESLLMRFLASVFNAFGDYGNAGLIAEVCLFTSDIIAWPMPNFTASVLSFAFTALTDGNIELADHVLKEYGKDMFGCDGSISSQIFVKYYAIYQATKSMMARSLVDDDVLATIQAHNQTEYLYWSAYNCVIRNDWERSDNVIQRLWGSITTMTNENSDLVLRILLLEAEICCQNGNPTGALEPLFEGLELAKKMSTDYYIMLYQLHICTIQLYLDLPQLAIQTLHSDTMVKCRGFTKLLRAKLIVVNAKMILLTHFPSKHQRIHATLTEVFTLFQPTWTGSKFTGRKEAKKYRKTNWDTVGTSKSRVVHDSHHLFRQIEFRLKEAKYIYHNFENHYLRAETALLLHETYVRRGWTTLADSAMDEVCMFAPCDISHYADFCIL